MRLALLAAASLGLATAAQAQTPDMPPPGAPMPGGWSEASPKDPGVIAAAHYAATQIPGRHGPLRRVAKAQAQVVAGMNYRLELVFAHGPHWQATVFAQLGGGYQLTASAPIHR